MVTCTELFIVDNHGTYDFIMILYCSTYRALI